MQLSAPSLRVHDSCWLCSTCVCMPSACTLTTPVLQSASASCATPGNTLSPPHTRIPPVSRPPFPSTSVAGPGPDARVHLVPASLPPSLPSPLSYSCTHSHLALLLSPHSPLPPVTPQVVMDLGRRPEARFLGSPGGDYLREAEVRLLITCLELCRWARSTANAW